MSIESVFQEKAKKEQQESIKTKESKESRLKAEEMRKSNIQKIQSLMDQIYTAFSEASKQIRANQHCCTLTSRPEYDLASNLNYTTEIRLGGIWKEEPTKKCKELNEVDLIKNEYIQCSTAQDYKTITFSIIRPKNKPIEKILDINNVSNVSKLIEGYIEEFLSSIFT